MKRDVSWTKVSLFFAGMLLLAYLLGGGGEGYWTWMYG